MNPEPSARIRAVLGTAFATASLVVALCVSSAPSSAATSATASGAAVNIGFMDIEGSLGISFEPQRVMAQQYVSYLDSKGGLNGHHINLITCVTQSASGGATCANEFVQKHAILAFDYSIIDSANVYPILKSAGIPVFGGGGSPLDAADLTPDGNHWFVGGGALVAFSVDNVFLAKTLHAKSVGLLVGTSGAAQQAAQTFIEKPLAAMGVTTTPVNIQESNPDYTAAIDTVSSTNVIEPLEGAAGVDAAIKQAKALNYKGEAFGGLDPTDIKAMGSAAPGVYGALPNIVPSKSNESQPAVKLYASLEKRYGWNWGDLSAYQMVATGIDVAKMAAGTTGVPTGLQVRQAFATATNVPIPLGGPAGLTCSKAQSPLAPTACNVQLLLFKVEKNGSVEPVTGQWASPPSPSS